jgi:hypothetical protein
LLGRVRERSPPPMKRLRLRGDWSDTGPNARPETQFDAEARDQEPAQMPGNGEQERIRKCGRGKTNTYLPNLPLHIGPDFKP